MRGRNGRDPWSQSTPTGFDVPLLKSFARPRRIGEKNKQLRRRSDQMSLDWDATIPVHARFLRYSCPSSTSDFGSNGFVRLLSSGSPRSSSTYTCRRCQSFTLDSQSPCYVLSSGAAPVIGVFGRRKRDRVFYCIGGRHSPTFYRSWTNRSLPNFRAPRWRFSTSFSSYSCMTLFPEASINGWILPVRLPINPEP